jgi:hypothetical protein
MKISKFPKSRIVRKRKEKSTLKNIEELLDFHTERLHDLIADYPEIDECYWMVNDLRRQLIEEIHKKHND